ncbi:acyltransferase family protein [Buttiauxella noackiae]|uniref:acyltransferase family protein n=1 Tax=Buttiauxella noackiae TaxID=82992 RepID=UPI000553E0DB|nr:acyltransferase family protein [Buttiauxella noackiae]
MKNKQLWINHIKGLCICLVVIYHSVITFYPHLTQLEAGLPEYIAKSWIYLNLYLAPFRMPVFFFISGFLITRYIESVKWPECMDKRIWNIFYVLVLWGVLQWLGISLINQWLAPDLVRNPTSNAAYSETLLQFATSMAKASTSLWYLYALIVYFVIFKSLHCYKVPVIIMLLGVNVAISFMPLPWWGMNSVVRNMCYYGLGAWFGPQLMTWMKATHFRQHPLLCTAVALLSVALYLVNVPVVISVVSIFVIMKLFYILDSWRESRSDAFLNIVGSNTIAIYTTHRIIIEALSLFMIGQINTDRISDNLLIAVLLVYPFVSLATCTLIGLGFRKLSRALWGDLFFTPPAKMVFAADRR